MSMIRMAAFDKDMREEGTFEFAITFHHQRVDENMSGSSKSTYKTQDKCSE